jgi:hypothetical protein
LFSSREKIPVSNIVFNASPVKVIAITRNTFTANIGSTTRESSITSYKAVYSFVRGLRNRSTRERDKEVLERVFRRRERRMCIRTVSKLNLIALVRADSFVVRE